MLPVSPQCLIRASAESLISDIDILNFYLSGHVPSSVASYGALHTFKQSKKPKEAGDAQRCLSCAYEPACVWSAKKIYLDQFNKDEPHVSHEICAPADDC